MYGNEKYIPTHKCMGNYKIFYSSYLQKYVAEILAGVFAQNQVIDKFWNKLHYQMRNLKISIIESSCLYELKLCIEKSLKIIENWNSDSDPKWPDT